jgi:hypothetical protein
VSVAERDVPGGACGPGAGAEATLTLAGNRAPPGLARALDPLEVVLDGELIVTDAHGRPRFEQVLRRLRASSAPLVRQLRHELPVTHVIFDLLWQGDRPVLGPALPGATRPLGGAAPDRPRPAPWTASSVPMGPAGRCWRPAAPTAWRES